MSSTITPQPFNYSLHAIPAAFLLSLVPHSYYTTRLMFATNYKFSTAMPRTNLDVWKSKLPEKLWNHLARARGAHLNSLEVFPLFAAAMLAGKAVGMDAKEMNGVAASWLTARVMYMGLYIGITHNGLALARTGVYAWSIGIPIMALWRAGNVANARDVQRCR